MFKETKSRSIIKTISWRVLATPLEVCEKRDTTGIYEKARRGETNNLPGVDVEYEVPESPALKLDDKNNKAVNYSNLIVKKIINNFNNLV